MMRFALGTATLTQSWPHTTRTSVQQQNAHAQRDRARFEQKDFATDGKYNTCKVIDHRY